MARQKPKAIGEVSRQGGWRGSPNSTAAGMANIKPYAEQRKCAKCRALAVRGSRFCLRHGAGGGKARRDGGFGRAESRYLARLERLGLLPLDLLPLPCWRRLTEFPTRQRSPMRLALLQAWDKRDRDPLHWARTQKQALTMVADPGDGRARHVAWYMEAR